jgi:hypothetical protein
MCDNPIDHAHRGVEAIKAGNELVADEELIGRLEECIRAQGRTTRMLLMNTARPDKCRGCEAEIFWVRHLNGRSTPYTSAGVNHFVNCPKAADFKKQGG